MNNPFESGQIKNYLLLYASIVVIMVLFFIASTLFNDIQVYDKKSFDVNVSLEQDSSTMDTEQNTTSRVKLLDYTY